MAETPALAAIWPGVCRALGEPEGQWQENAQPAHPSRETGLERVPRRAYRLPEDAEAFIAALKQTFPGTRELAGDEAPLAD